MNRNRSLLLFILSMVLMGTIGIFRRWIPISSELLAFFRGLIGALSLFLYAGIAEPSSSASSSKPDYLLIPAGIVLGLNWIFLFEAYRFTTIARATLCYYMEPTIVLFLSPVLFHEPLSRKKTVCGLGALLGMVFVSGVLEGGSGPQDLRGILCGLLAACFYAMVVIFNKKSREGDVYRRTRTELLTAALVLFPYLLLTGSFSGLPNDAGVIGLILLVGVVHTGLVYVMYFGSMANLEAQTISLLSYIDPLTAMAVSVLVLKEPLSIHGIIGAVLILGCALLGERSG